MFSLARVRLVAGQAIRLSIHFPGILRAHLIARASDCCFPAVLGVDLGCTLPLRAIVSDSIQKRKSLAVGAQGRSGLVRHVANQTQSAGRSPRLRRVCRGMRIVANQTRALRVRRVLNPLVIDGMALGTEASTLCP